MNVQHRYINIGLNLHVQEWLPETFEVSKTSKVFSPFVLLHGLSSNCRTWEFVAARLTAAGHYVVAVDQRGHGLSDKPSTGYDFATITADLADC
jgi:pimeloyl-ACP methyl ester carboxylesterase